MVAVADAQVAQRSGPTLRILGDGGERVLGAPPGRIDEHETAPVALAQLVEDVAREIKCRRYVPSESARFRHARGFADRADAPAAMEIDAARLMRASRLRVGRVRAMGVPAILMGVAGIIVAAGVSRSFRTIAPMLPETLRELKGLLEAGRDARSLKP